MKKLLYFSIFSICLFQTSFGQTDDKVVLTNLVNEFLSKVDSKEMHDRFWAEDLIYTSSSGKRFGKETIMSGFSSSEEDSNSEPGPSYSAEDIQVNLLSNEVAIVAFKLVSLTSDGSISQYLNSGTFQKKKGLWKVVNWQATKIPGE
ncbi:nuclear transport factor 2 family protein [Fulvivirga lutea]|uniref:Nuclear transport factor 2 family protein n=1 Tax=Fulvivirga lutea TaxID=2810512 RepID=A0A975A230_9BACT|nr:nuclear transport factor 2 family protein [Fulvivirga lutea]QSE98860.1 nuclear transport factor 2 family protein [Fulvivirga lutea]